MPPIGWSTTAVSGNRASPGWTNISPSCKGRRKMGQRTSAAMQTAEAELYITRIFNAPRSLVFRAWIEPAHLAHWWGPKGFTTLSCDMDVRPGGTWFRLMRAPDGSEHRKRGVYREIVEPDRLVFTDASEDADGNA